MNYKDFSLMGKAMILIFSEIDIKLLPKYAWGKSLFISNLQALGLYSLKYYRHS